MAENIHTYECRDLPIDKVVVYNERAEITRRISTKLVNGSNEIHVKNVTHSFINDSVRVDGKGDAVIHEVTTQYKQVLVEEIDTPKVADIRPQHEAKKAEIAVLQDRESVLKTRVKSLDLIAENLATKIFSQEGQGASSFNALFNEGLTENIEKFYTFYDQKANDVRRELREVRDFGTKAFEELKHLETLLGNGDVERFSNSKVIVIALESENGGPVELDLIYQVHNVSWFPTYNLRVDTTVPSLQVSYFGQVQQSTNEDWNDAKIILSTSKPHLSGTKPKLGTLEVSFEEKNQQQPVMMQSIFATPATSTGGLFGSATCTPGANFSFGVPVKRVERAVASEVKDQVLSSEFTIARRTTIPSGKDKIKVTIGIIELKTLLVHKCTPSKNTSVFLTATAVNESELQLLQGNVNVYLNNSYLAKTSLKNVSPGERFNCSLGVDPGVRVDYKPARKYIEEAGNFNKCASHITEQMIQIRNSRQNEVLLTIHENIPRTTDDKIKIYVMSPNPACIEGLQDPDNLNETFKSPTEGTRLNHEHNLEWTVKLAPGEIENLEFKWSAEYPKEEKVRYTEKF